MGQVVHHLADSHLNGFVRMKLMLTEVGPVLKPYDQDAWAKLPDTAALPIESSMLILKGLHERWVALLENLPEATWSRSAFHPESRRGHTRGSTCRLCSSWRATCGAGHETEGCARVVAGSARV